METKREKVKSESRSKKECSSQSSANVDDPEQNVEEFERLSGQGSSSGWRFDREEVHERR